MAVEPSTGTSDHLHAKHEVVGRQVTTFNDLLVMFCECNIIKVGRLFQYNFHYWFTITQETNFKAPVQEFTSAEVDQIGWRYYNTDVHRASFVLPQFAHKVLWDFTSAHENIT